METIQKIMEPLQDAILRTAKTAATMEGEAKAQVALSLEDMRRSDKLMRERLYVLQVWKKHGYETANKLSRKMAREYDDPDLAKLLEEKEKREEKDRREKEKEKDRARAQAFNAAKRPRFGSSPFSRGGAGGSFNPSPLAATYGQYKAQSSGYGYRGGARGGHFPRDSKSEKCHICGETGHFWRNCQAKK